MKLFGKTHIVVSAITFIIIFLMNYVGNTLPDRLSTAIMNGVAGVVGLSVGIFILYKAKDKDNNHQEFD